MQRLNFKPDEKLSRKEYLKRKKKQARTIKSVSKITYILIATVVILSIYVFTQFYVYSKSNNYKYVAGDGVSDQKIYNVYYITEGYTYSPKYTLNSINTDGFDDKVVFDNAGLTSIISAGKYVYGIKDGGLYRLDKDINQLEMIVEKDVNKYTIYNNEIYVVMESTNKLKIVNVDTKELKELNIDNVSEVVVDDKNIFVAIDEKVKKDIVRYDKSGANKTELAKNSNASYMIQATDKVYYVNKSDSSKIYYVAKDGSSEGKIADITCMSDNGSLKEIDGSKYMFVNGNFLYYVNTGDSNSLWRINLTDKSTEKVIQMGVEILQNVDNTVFYKVKNEMGVYLYNYDTKFMSQVTKSKVSEFYVDNAVVDTTNRQNTQSRN